MEPVYSNKFRAGRRRTYFFDVRETREGDYYLTITESKKRMDGGYDRHKIFLYKEDVNKFMEFANQTVNHLKTNLMPEYDFDEYARKQEEWEREHPHGSTPANDGAMSNFTEEKTNDEPQANPTPMSDSVEAPPSNEDDLKW